MDEPTRPLPSMTPMPGGVWRATSTMTPSDFKIRGLALKPSNSVIPVIVVPGIMGTNLRAKIKPRSKEEMNQVLRPGQEAWRPPNTTPGGLWDALVWDRVPPARRQQLLDPDTLEVDDSGPPHIHHGDGRQHIRPDMARERWWGELHADSYDGLLCGLHSGLNQTFWRDGPDDDRHIRQHWLDVMACDPKKWDFAQMKPLTEADLEKHARHHYPVYGAGYNWLRSCLEASQRLEQRILHIIAYWQGLGRKCEQVILVTHSMGGLVARACAKRIPDKIAGVIHGVMPALGAPAAYRRMACGTEVQDLFGKFAAKILGATTYDTTPVLATSPGPLELLPNHLYPRPWLHVSVMQSSGARAGETASDYLHLPSEENPNPYDLYRGMKPWFRLVDPALADPAGKFKLSIKKGGVEQVIKDAIDTAEQFHTKHLGDYYHPNTYAFYGADPEQLAFGQVRWVGTKQSASSAVFTMANVSAGTFSRHDPEGGRLVEIEPGCPVLFKPAPPDARGDRTVPHQSGAGPSGKVQHLFETRGYDHQGSYNNEDMLMLTMRLVVRIVQGIPA